MAEPGDPIVGRLPRALAVAPYVPIALGIVSRRAGHLKPGMLVGSVIGDEIQNDAVIMFFCFFDEMIEVSQSAVLRVDGQVIGDIVAKIDLGRGINGSNPDGVNAEVPEVAEARGNTVEIAYTVTIGVLKTARVDFIDDCVLPPMVLADVGPVSTHCSNRLLSEIKHDTENNEKEEKKKDVARGRIGAGSGTAQGCIGKRHFLTQIYLPSTATCQNALKQKITTPVVSKSRLVSVIIMRTFVPQSGRRARDI